MTAKEGRLDPHARAGRVQAETQAGGVAAGSREAGRISTLEPRYLEAFFRHALTPLALLDREFNFIMVNEAYAKADQREVDDFPGRNHFDLYPSDAREIFEEVVRTGRPYQAAARPFVYAEHPERGVTYWDWTLTPLLDADGEVEVLVFALEDVTPRKQAEMQLERQREHLEVTVRARTRELEAANARLQAEIVERKRAEEALREADRQKTQFLAVLSHELRNPLAAIRNSLAILERVPLGGEAAGRAKAIIDRQSVQLAHLVDDLLDVSRITQNKITLQRERLDLIELLRRVLEDHQPMFARNELHIGLDFEESSLFVQGDRTRLSQVFGNLLQNAVKFTPRGGSIRVVASLDKAAGYAIVRVSDTGIGIEPEMIPLLFKPFVQIDIGLDRRNGGLGLGLALVKGLVELHGGEVGVVSPGSGQGTEFTIKIPRDGGEAEEKPRTSPAPQKHRRILIIEDNPESGRELAQLAGTGWARDQGCP